jgi:serine/threonine-protein kinase RsbW
MPDEPWIWHCEHHIPSKTGAGRRILNEILKQLEKHHWQEHDIFGVHLAIEEALVNAIKHGNRLDQHKRVHVVCHVAPDRVRVEITDEGQGFDFTQVPDPTDPSNLESPCGRGIMLMKSFMNRVEFDESGSRVVMEKQRDGA